MSDCIFCKIIKGEIPAKFVYKDDFLVAFYDINPRSPVHVLIVSKKHIESLRHVEKQDKELLGQLLMSVDKIAKKLKISKSGYQLTIANGRNAGQEVFHMHFHLKGGWKK